MVFSYTVSIMRSSAENPLKFQEGPTFLKAMCGGYDLTQLRCVSFWEG